MSISYRLCAHKGGIDPEDKGKGADLSGLIKWWGRPNPWNPVGMAKYSHVEIQRGSGDCFSADGYYNVVRHKEIRFSHPQRWDLFDLGVYSTAEDDKIQWRCDKIEGKKYDYIGGVTCPWRGAQIDHRWYCSETGLWIMGAALGAIPTNLYPDAAVKMLLTWTANRRKPT